jgi:hypothetical protein
MAVTLAARVEGLARNLTAAAALAVRPVLAVVFPRNLTTSLAVLAVVFPRNLTTSLPVLAMMEAPLDRSLTREDH